MDKRIIAQVQSFGFDVYMRDPDKDTWLHFTDGTNIGYLQLDRLRGITLSTVHVPNKTTGTGYSLDVPDALTEEALRNAFIFAPSWSSERDRASVKKWPSMEAFLKASAWNGSYKLVPKEPIA